MHKTTKKNTWSLQDAKARFSEVVRLAETQGPQHVTRHGGEAVVIIRSADFAKLAGAPNKSLVDVLVNAPFRTDDLDFSRIKGPDRGTGK
ncbi:MAG: type II toxin-antitoxin system prevent-host-death family antitoxin [Bryobacterales bacterium]|nr:type II toxin-antitoxin system prevent-host-death family antitoxin [Bryobacterales bacterium]